MQNIINQIQSGDINTNQLLQQLTTYESKAVDDFNESLDRNDAIAKELESAHYTLKKQHEAILKQVDNEEIYKDNQAYYQSVNKAMIDSCKVSDHKLSVEKKEHKAAKEQIKRNKAAATMKDKKIDALTKQLDKLKTNQKSMGELVQIAHIEDEQLLMFPTRQIVNGKRSAVLLYTNGNGCYLTGHLVGEKAAFSTFIKRDSKLADKTKIMIENNSMKPSERIEEIAGKWLYKINVMQNCDIKAEDLTLIKK